MTKEERLDNEVGRRVDGLSEMWAVAFVSYQDSAETKRSLQLGHADLLCAFRLPVITAILPFLQRPRHIRRCSERVRPPNPPPFPEYPP